MAAPLSQVPDEEGPDTPSGCAEARIRPAGSPLTPARLVAIGARVGIAPDLA